MEADLQRFYGIDLADLYTGQLSPRRAKALVEHLPPSSSTWAAVHDLPTGWSLTDFLLMDVWEALTGEEHYARPHKTKTHRKQAPGAPSSRAADLRARLLAQRERLAAADTE